MSSPGSPIVVGDWTLTPEGAVVHPRLKTAVIADVHLGYEWARGGRGEVVPAHSRAETIAKLSALSERWRFVRLVVAGDLVESPRSCPRTARDLAALRRWLDGQAVELLALRGNHDPEGGRESCEIDGWTIIHGDRPVAAPRRIVGHNHPAFRKLGLAAPCFLVSPSLIVLPAFSNNAAGIDVTSQFLPDELSDPSLRCIVGHSGELFDFGPRATLQARLASR
jgi:putative SbcD/Mre11-related phosphoesterase